MNQILPPPYHVAAKAMAVLWLIVVAAAVLINFSSPIHMDFVSYWAASVLTLEGNPAGAYDLALHQAVERRAVPLDVLMPFAYPPPFLLLVAPFALLPYPAAAAIWIVLTFTLYLLAARRMAPGAALLAAALPAVVVNGVIGQNGFLTAALFIAAATQLPTRPLLAGLLLGLLVIKPQLGILIPLALLAGREWRAFAGATLAAGGTLLLALLLLGPATYAAMLELGPMFGRIAADGLTGWHKMASSYAALRLLGAPAELAWTMHALLALGAAALLWRIWRSPAGRDARLPALAAATLLASPYIYVYDSLILLLPFVWLWQRGTSRPALLTLWCLPLVSVAQSFGIAGIINPMPLVALSLLLLIAGELQLLPRLRRASPVPIASAGTQA